MDCEAMEVFIFEFLDSQLMAKDGAALSSHLHQCQDCRVKMDDLLKLRASLQFHKAMDTPPVADKNFALSVLGRLAGQESFVPQPATAGWTDKISLFFTPYRVRWLVPAFAIILFLILPLSMMEKQGANKEEARIPTVVNLAENTVTQAARPIPVHQMPVPVPVHQAQKQTELDEYLMFHAQNASQSHIGYPVVYASY